MPPCGHPGLGWPAGNARLRPGPAGTIPPVRPQHGAPTKIAGIVALVMALRLAMFEAEGNEPGIVVL